MNIIRKITISLFIFSSSLAISSVSYAANETLPIQSQQQDSIGYDDFDAMADDMVDRGITQDELKPLSTVDRWMQGICSPIIMRYVLLKRYMRDWGYWMIGVKKN